MPYTKCFYHLIWSTKHRQAVITPVYEALIFAAIREKCRELDCEVLALNAAWDHLHLAINMPPSLSIAHVVGVLKGSASHGVNTGLDNIERFRWQESYSAFTFGEISLDSVVSYITKKSITAMARRTRIMRFLIDATPGSKPGATGKACKPAKAGWIIQRAVTAPLMGLTAVRAAGCFERPA